MSRYSSKSVWWLLMFRGLLNLALGHLQRPSYHSPISLMVLRYPKPSICNFVKSSEVIHRNENVAIPTWLPPPWVTLGWRRFRNNHYSDVKMGAIASQITSVTIVYSTIYSGADQRKHESPASLGFVQGIHRWPVNSPHKGPVTRKMIPFDDVIMNEYISRFWRDWFFKFH